MKKIHLIMFCIFVFHSISAQMNEYMQITPPAPNAVALGRFGDIPPGGATGIPTISIPIYKYERTEENFNLSISLDYFAGGIRVGEIASNIGIGWALNAGGVISRTLCGTWDELTTYGFCSYTPPSSESIGNSWDRDPTFFRQIATYMRDSKYDIFNFNFNGRSGKFVLGRNNRVLILSQEKLKIEKVQDFTRSGRIVQFKITDEKGYQYIFADAEIMYNSYLDVNSVYTSSWYLSKIISPSGGDNINFSYGKTSYQYQVGMSESECFPLNDRADAPRPRSTSTLTLNLIEGKRLEKISFPNGVVLDCKYETTSRKDLSGDYLLNKFIISEGISQRGFILEQDYSLNRATLKKVIPFSFYKNTEISESAYKFDYNSSLPSNRFDYRQDHWGLFNDNRSQSLTPRIEFVWNNKTHRYGSADRSTHPLQCLSGSLHRLYYPTGGYTEFEMEANTVINHRFNDKYAGGLRLRQMTNYLETGKVALVKQYKYTDKDGKSSGKLGTFPIYHDLLCYEVAPLKMGPNSENLYSNGIPNYVVINSSTITPLCYIGGSPVTYSMITEYVSNGQMSEGKTERYYRVNDGSYAASDYPYIPPSFVPSFYGQEDSVKVYDSNGLLLKKERNKYTFYKNEWMKDYNATVDFRSVVIAPVTFQGSISYGYPEYYISNQYYPHAGRVELESKEITVITDSESVTTTKLYTYNSHNRMIKTEATTDSKGKTLVKHYKYPQDIINEGKDLGGIYAGMISKNMINEIVETITTNNNQLITLTRNNYYNPYLGLYLLKNRQIQHKNSSIDTLMTFEHDTIGKVMSMTHLNGNTTIILWGYNYQYPIARIENITYAQVKAIIGENVIKSIAKKSTPSSSDMKIINDLRNHPTLANSLITTYTYQPLEGITSINDNRGIVTYYVYDTFGRLCEIYYVDNNGNKAVQATYHYNFK